MMQQARVPLQPSPDSSDALLTARWILPPFAQLTPERAKNALFLLLARAREQVTAAQRAVEQAKAITWREWYQPLEESLSHLSEFWNLIHHYHSVLDTPLWRACHNELLPTVTRFFTEVHQDPILYRGLKRLRDEDPHLTPAQLRLLELEIRDRWLAGAELRDEKQRRYLEIAQHLAEAEARFSENLLDATNAYIEYRTEEEIAGLPEETRHLARTEARHAGKEGVYRFTLHAPYYQSILQYAEDRDWRARFYRAYATRASEFGPPEQDNGPLIEKILSLRQEQAQLLSFPTYAHYSLIPKMAESPETVERFLLDLTAVARPLAERELEELTRFARDQLHLTSLEPWDIPYAAEKLRQLRFGYSDYELRRYFPLPKVLDGLILFLERLYGILLEEVVVSTWHSDVRCYRLHQGGHTLGYLYLDLYARTTKKGGAWMADAKSRHRRPDGEYELPVAYLITNFAPPAGETPTTLTHEELLTLLHELGHVLHHLLTVVDERPISGLNHVEWDAVELPSQHLEYFGWSWEVLQNLSAHIETGEPLPRSLFEKLLAARYFHVGLATVRQLEFALFDWRIHRELGLTSAEGFPRVRLADLLGILDEVRRQVAVVVPPSWHRLPHTFSHIFAGGYAAGYYSYLWAEVLAADAFSAFEEAAQRTGTLLDPETGARFRSEILAVGATRPMHQSFRAFRGRDPILEPFFRLVLGLPPSPPEATA